jgi:hypothetical protein
MARYFTYSTNDSISELGNSEKEGIAVPGMPLIMTRRRSSSVGLAGLYVFLNLNWPWR